MFNNNLEVTIKNKKTYICNKCNYYTHDKCDYNKHLLTRKHELNSSYDISLINNSKKVNILYLSCECGKIYKSRQGLYNHKKKCSVKEMNNAEMNNAEMNNAEMNIIGLHTNESNNNANDELKQLVCKLITENNEIKNTIMKENKELRDQVSELIPKVGNNNNNINQKFNINVFLNEQCKDAINLDDFIKSIQISIDQLDYSKSNGLTEGLSNIIIENIKQLNLHERPIHCTDLKRETLYIKNHDIWCKNNQDKSCLKHAINKLSSKQYKALINWVNHNPDYLTNEYKQDYYAKTLSVIGKPTSNIDNKIIKNICSNTYIKNDILK